jgi:methionyl-tRNA synthetase
VARVSRLVELKKFSAPRELPTEFSPTVKVALENFLFNDALSAIWSQIRGLDVIINKEKPWEWEALDEHPRLILASLVNGICQIAYDLQPFLPETAEKILQQFSGEIKSAAPLFPRV